MKSYESGALRGCSTGKIELGKMSQWPIVLEKAERWARDWCGRIWCKSALWPEHAVGAVNILSAANKQRRSGCMRAQNGGTFWAGPILSLKTHWNDLEVEAS